ncbi:hypothetical protein [Streptomyces sp. NPDC048312]|uniref:hypothetical protein n=1 Tax=Streptomyces sp. NPDC048312 TaxID=3155485 RepID=UPI00340F61D1
MSILICLAVLDPMVVVLMGLVRSAGVRPASSVVALDVIANRIVNWPQLQENPAWLRHPVGLLPTTLFCLFVIAPLVPWFPWFPCFEPREGDGASRLHDPMPVVRGEGRPRPDLLGEHLVARDAVLGEGARHQLEFRVRAEQPAYPDADAGGRGVRGEGEFPTGALPSSNPARWIASASRAYYAVVGGTTTVKAVTRLPGQLTARHRPAHA